MDSYVPLFSDMEPVYERVKKDAMDLQDTTQDDRNEALETYLLKNMTQQWEDVGILARLKDHEFYNFVIAGIHQIGTWSAAEFLDRLLQKKLASDEDFFLGEEEAIAVIWGKFSGAKFGVVETGVHRHLRWVRSGDQEWIRVGER